MSSLPVEDSNMNFLLTRELSAMSQYLTKKNESSVCSFTHADSVRSLLRLSNKCDYGSSNTNDDMATPECTNFLESWKEDMTSTLVKPIALVNIPSPQADFMLEQLSQNRFCKSCQYDAVEGKGSILQHRTKLKRWWLRLIWAEYSKANTRHPVSDSTHTLMPASFTVRSWQKSLQVLQDKGRYSAFSIPDRTMPKQTGDQEISKESVDAGTLVAGRTRKKGGKLATMCEDDIFTSPPVVKKSGTPERTQSVRRPVLRRELAGTNIPQLDSIPPVYIQKAWQQCIDGEKRTPLKQSSFSDDVLSPNSVSSASSPSLFDVRGSPERGTPLSIDIASPADSNRSPSSKMRPGKNSRDLSLSSVELLNSPHSKQLRSKTSVYNRRKIGKDQPTVESTTVALDDEMPRLEQPRTQESENDTSLEGPAIHSFERLGKVANPLKHGLDCLQRSIAQSNTIPGYVYCYRHVERPGYLKIGYARCTKMRFMKIEVVEMVANTFKIAIYHKPKSHSPEDIPSEVQERYKHWQDCCKYKVHHVFSYAMPCAAEKMESLVHAELHAKRHRVINCNPDANKPCSTQHDEWFQVSEHDAREAVIRWQKFSQCHPYDRTTGDLKDIWRYAAKRSLDKTTRVAGLELSAWVEAHVNSFRDGTLTTKPFMHSPPKKSQRAPTWNMNTAYVENRRIGQFKQARTWFTGRDVSDKLRIPDIQSIPSKQSASRKINLLR